MRVAPASLTAILITALAEQSAEILKEHRATFALLESPLVVALGFLKVSLMMRLKCPR